MMFYLLMTVFAVTLIFTGGLRRYAIENDIIDVPNHRSSHLIPTPRGGGVAFIAVILLTVPILAYQFPSIHTACWALMSAGFFISIVGFMDDRKPISARVRLISHFSASALALYCLGGLPSIVIFGALMPTGLLFNVIALVYLVWLLNLYNFMDGIDGLAAIEAITVCLSLALLYWLNSDLNLMGLPLVIAAAVAGFFCWNFPPARIFMGDAGSGFLGLAMGVLSIQAAWVRPEYLWESLILLGVFIVDATFTLIHRFIRGCKVFEAHRSHAYQHASRQFGRHLWVTLVVLMINVFWLLPLAVMVNQSSLDGATLLLIAYSPLIILAWKFNAGYEY